MGCLKAAAGHRTYKATAICIPYIAGSAGFERASVETDIMWVGVRNPMDDTSLREYKTAETEEYKKIYSFHSLGLIFRI